MGISKTSTISQAALNTVVLPTSLLKKAKPSSLVSWTPDSSHLNYSARHAADISLRDLFIEWQLSSGKCNFTGFLYLVFGTYLFYYFSSTHEKIVQVPFLFFCSSKCQTCAFTRPSAFLSLCLAGPGCLPPYLCLYKSHTSRERHFMKASLIMQCPVLWPFFSHMWFK